MFSVKVARSVGVGSKHVLPVKNSYSELTTVRSTVLRSLGSIDYL